MSERILAERSRYAPTLFDAGAGQQLQETGR
jgi:hypothetical protein